jgi:hypothetical protein
MMFHAPTGRMVMEAAAIKSAAMHMRWALKSIREAAKLPLDRYDRNHEPLKPADFAQIAVIEAAEALGIDLGVPRQRFYELDLRDAG